MITRGMGSGSLITRGLGGGLIGVIREIIRGVSKLCFLITGSSKIKPVVTGSSKIDLEND